MSGHTPGNWKAKKLPYGMAAVMVGNKYIANRMSADTEGEAMANAMLIAAAPKLLASLNYLLGCCELNLDEMEYDTIDAIDAAREVIAEATGETVEP